MTARDHSAGAIHVQMEIQVSDEAPIQQRTFSTGFPADGFESDRRDQHEA